VLALAPAAVSAGGERKKGRKEKNVTSCDKFLAKTWPEFGWLCLDDLTFGLLAKRRPNRKDQPQAQRSASLPRKAVNLRRLLS
jgi:hypothetical protein